jgi:hypothetical protein
MTTKIIPEIKRFDQGVQDEYDRIQLRKRELFERLTQVKAEISKVTSERAEFVAAGSDHLPHSHRLTELRAEQEALEDAHDFLSTKLEQIKRANTWIG